MSDVLAVPPAPPPPPPPSQRPGTTFDFARPFAYTFEDPEWLQKVLLGGLFTLAAVFVIGAFFVYGYLARLARNVIAGMERPLPAWDDLGEYFGEGLRLFAVGLVYSVPIIMLVMVFVLPSIAMQMTDSDAVRTAGGAMATCVWCILFPASLALAVWMPAALVMAAVERRFGAAFDFTRIWAFIRGNAGNYALAYLVWLVARFVAGFGLILLCVGIVFTIFWSLLVGVFAFAQTYRLSVTR